MSGPVCLIVNPTAGGGKSGRLAPEMEQALRAEGLTVRRVETRHLDHARELADEAVAAGETVVTLSGDGLLGVVADALRHHPGSVIGILPGGRGNDLARVLGIPDDARQACRALATGVPRPVDLGVVEAPDSSGETQAFVGIASAGFDSEANRIANEAPSWLGGLVYAYGALRALLSWRPARFEIELQPSGQRHAFTGYTVAAANSRAYGGGMYLAPDAMLDDGLLDVVVTEQVGKLRFLANLPKVFKGAHVKLQSVHVFQAEEVLISSDRPFTLYADGDPIGELPVRIRALPGAVTIITPSTGGPALRPAGAPSGPAKRMPLDGAGASD